jgi:hypothetical protein
MTQEQKMLRFRRWKVIKTSLLILSIAAVIAVGIWYFIPTISRKPILLKEKNKRLHKENNILSRINKTTTNAIAFKDKEIKSLKSDNDLLVSNYNRLKNYNDRLLKKIDSLSVIHHLSAPVSKKIPIKKINHRKHIIAHWDIPYSCSQN